MPLFAEQDKCRGVNALILINHMAEYGTLTDANINALSTGVAGLLALIVTGELLNTRDTPVFDAAREAVREMESFGVLTDANLNAITTGLPALRTLIFTGGGLTSIDIDPVTRADGSWVYSGNISRETLVGR